MTTGDRTTQVAQILAELSPAMQADGGGVDLIAVEGGTVSVRLRGTCLVCPSASLTVREGLERALRQNLPWVTGVVRLP